MSRGYGKWERAILAALEYTAAFYLTDLLPPKHTRAQIVALNRAARNLKDKGRIASCTWLTQGKAAAGFVTIYRPGYPQPELNQITRLNVAPEYRGPRCNT